MLELGGAPRDPGNLWPEPHYTKDGVEIKVKNAVCAGTITLSSARGSGQNQLDHSTVGYRDRLTATRAALSAANAPLTLWSRRESGAFVMPGTRRSFATGPVPRGFPLGGRCAVACVLTCGYAASGTGPSALGSSGLIRCSTHSATISRCRSHNSTRSSHSNRTSNGPFLRRSKPTVPIKRIRLILHLSQLSFRSPPVASNTSAGTVTTRRSRRWTCNSRSTSGAASPGEYRRSIRVTIGVSSLLQGSRCRASWSEAPAS